MILRYPYELYIDEKTQGGFDNDGFPLPASDSERKLGSCRIEPASAGDIVSLESGDKTNYKYKIYMPLGEYFLEPNTNIHIKENDGNTRLKTTVIRFEKNQLHAVIWA